MQTEEVKEVSHTWEDDIPLVKDEDSQVEVDAIGTVAPDDAYEVRTRHSFATHPVSKGVIVLGASFMLMSILGIFLKALTGGFSNSGNVAKVDPQTTPTPNINQNSISEADTLKAKLMFSDQRKDISDFNRQKTKQNSQKTSPSTIRQVTPVQSVPITVAPRQSYPPQVPYSPQVQSRPVIPTSSHSSPRRATSPPSPIPPQITTPPPEHRDPMAEWIAAANIGSYGSTSPTSVTSSSSPTQDDSYQSASYQGDSTDSSTWEASGGTGIPPQEVATAQNAQSQDSIAKSSVKQEQDNTTYQSATYSNPANNLIVGTRANGKLETPIAWTGRLENPSQNFLIKLNEPLKSANNSMAIPKGAYLVAKVIAASEAGLLQMSVSSMLVNENGQTTEKPIPEGALLVLGKGGRPLKATAERPNTTGNDLGTVVLRGLATTAGIANRPSSQSIYSNDGYSSTVTNGDRNYLAGFGEGAAQALLEQAQNRNQQALRSRESEPTVFTLNQGSSVQIFVNQSVSL